MAKKSLITALSLFAISSTWAADSLKVSVENIDVAAYQLNEIVKVEPTTDSLIFTLSPSGRLATPIAGQKWVFETANVFSSTQVSSVSLSSSGAVSSSGDITTVVASGNKMDWNVQGSMLNVKSEKNARFEILSLNGSVLSKSAQGVKAWSVELGSQAVIFKMISAGANKSYLVQGVK
jgi:hypothetical protein